MISQHRKPNKNQPSIQWSIQDLLLGAIRAVDSCLDCHSSDSNTVSRGVLLGAFSYQFKGTEEFSMVEK